jgi:hypothetical protein
MPARVDDAAVRWHRSFYFRIGVSFVLFSVCLLVFQNLIFGGGRVRPPLRDRSPNTVAAIVAADLGSILSRDASTDLDAYLTSEYRQSQPIYVVWRNGHTASNRAAPLAEDMLRYLEDMLNDGARRVGVEPKVPVPFVTAPVHVNGTLRGSSCFRRPRPRVRWRTRSSAWRLFPEPCRWWC